jgi:O-antigen/teichoic acid export membrane protein
LLQNARTRYVAGSIATLFAGTMLVRLLITVALILTARDLGAESYGRYTATYVLLTQAMTLLNFGLDTWLLREGALGRTPISRSAGSALLIKSVFLIGWVPSVLLLAHVLNPQVYLPGLVFAAMIGVACQAFGLWAGSVFKSQLHNSTTVLLETVNVTVLFCLTLFLLGQGAEAAQFAWIRTLGLALMAGLGLVLVIRRFGLDSRWSDILPVGRRSFPFFLADGLAIIYASIDVTIVATILGEDALGVYVPAIVLVNALFIIPGTVYSVMVPVISRAYMERSRRVRAASIAFVGASSGLGLVIAIVVVRLADPIIRLVYGASFAASSVILSIIGGVLFFKSINFALGGILTAIDWQRQRVLAQFIAVVFNVVVNLLVIGRYGIIGVAWVYVLTEILLSIGYGFFALRGSRGFSFPYLDERRLHSY